MTLGLQEEARRLGRPVRVRLAVDKAPLVTTWSGFEQIPDGHTLVASLSAVNESSTLPLDTRPVPRLAFPYPGIRFHYAEITESARFPRFRPQVATQGDPRPGVLLP